MKPSDKTESEGPGLANKGESGLGWQVIYITTQTVSNGTVRPELKGKDDVIAFLCAKIISQKSRGLYQELKDWLFCITSYRRQRNSSCNF